MRRALITGITGQDGSHLAEFLLCKGYEVHGAVRQTSTPNCARIEHLRDRVRLHGADLYDFGSLLRLVQSVQPDEVYNLAAQSFVPASFAQPILTAEITGVGAARLLEAVRVAAPKARFYQASTSEMFGLARESPQREETPFHPRSPYAAAKVYAHHMTVNVREAYGLFACSGILFNHEGPRRGIEFVTRKVSSQVALIKHGLSDELRLGNLDAQRDWGYAGDYVVAMWLMLQQDEPRDYVIATGVSSSVRRLCELAFARAGLRWEEHVRSDATLLRPAEVEGLRGDAARAREELGWSPRTDFEGLVGLMVDADLALVERYGDALLRNRSLWYCAEPAP